MTHTYGGFTMSGKVWKYITEKIASEGACHFSLLDPDPLSTSIEDVVEQAKLVQEAGSDAIMIGGSTIFTYLVLLILISAFSGPKFW